MNTVNRRHGYARTSTAKGQSTDVQEEILLKAGCHHIFKEQVSGTSTKDRLQLEAMLSETNLRAGDTVVVTRLDRLARSQVDLHRILSVIAERGASFECTEQPEVNTSGPMGKLLVGVLGAVAEFETELRRERQMEGIAKAKAAGKYKGGQPVKAEKVAKLKELVDAGTSIAAACREVGMSRASAYKYL